MCVCILFAVAAGGKEEGGQYEEKEELQVEHWRNDLEDDLHCPCVKAMSMYVFCRPKKLLPFWLVSQSPSVRLDQSVSNSTFQLLISKWTISFSPSLHLSISPSLHLCLFMRSGMVDIIIYWPDCPFGMIWKHLVGNWIRWCYWWFDSGQAKATVGLFLAEGSNPAPPPPPQPSVLISTGISVSLQSEKLILADFLSDNSKQTESSGFDHWFDWIKGLTPPGIEPATLKCDVSAISPLKPFVLIVHLDVWIRLHQLIHSARVKVLNEEQIIIL